MTTTRQADTAAGTGDAPGSITLPGTPGLADGRPRVAERENPPDSDRPAAGGR